MDNSTLQQYAQIMSQTLNPDNVVRDNVEKAIEEAKTKNPDQFLIALCMLVKETSLDEGIRFSSLLALRRSVVLNRLVSTPWEVITPETKEIIKVHTLQILQSEHPVLLQRHVIDLVSNLATSVLRADGQWNELTQLLGQWSESEQEEKRIAATQIFSFLISSNISLDRFHEFLTKIFISGLSVPSAKVRVASLEASIYFLRWSPQFAEKFQGAVHNCFELVTACLSNKQDEVATEVLELLVQMIEIFPDSISRFIDPILEMVLNIASQRSQDERVRYLCLEIFTAIGENRPSCIRQRLPVLAKFLNLLLSMMALISECPKWNLGAEYDEEDDEREIGNSYLDRIALCIRDPIIAILFEPSMIPAMLNHPDWKVRHTALIAISLIGEGCAKAMKTNLDQVVQCILPSFQDPHERVRWAACSVVGQMATDFSPKFQKRYHQQVMSGIVVAMNDTANPRVQSYGAAAIINFCDECKPKTLAPYLPTLLQNLLNLLKSNSIVAIEQAVTATGAISDCVGAGIIPYYNELLPVLIAILKGKANADSLEARAKAIEAISLISSAAGSELFVPFSQEVLSTLLELENTTLPEEDPRIPLLNSSWGKYANALGKDFAPYLPSILPRIFKSAALEADVKILSPEQREDDTKWELLEIDDQNTLGINTVVVQEKSAAMTLLYWLSYELKELFYPHISQLLPICLAGLKFFYHENVRTAAVSIIPSLMDATRHVTGEGSDKVKEIFHYCFTPLLDAIANELYPSTTLVMLDAFEECLIATGKDCMTQEQFKGLAALLEKLLQTFLEKRKLKLHVMKTSEDQYEEAKEELEKQHEILIKVAEVVGKTLELYGPSVLPHITQIHEFYKSFLSLNDFVDETQCAACLFDDLVEFASPQAAPIYQSWIPFVVKLIGHEHTDVRQSSVFGMGILAELNPEAFKPFLNDCLNGCQYLINMEDSRDDDNIHVTENAICTLGKIILNFSSSVDLHQLIPAWFSYLPVLEDETYATYKHLCQFMMNHSNILLGANLERLPAVLTMFVEIYGTELVENETNLAIISILQTMQSQFPAGAMQAAFNSLSPQHQEKLKTIV